jgi:hypothetical protein
MDDLLYARLAESPVRDLRITFHRKDAKAQRERKGVQTRVRNIGVAEFACAFVAVGNTRLKMPHECRLNP